MKAGLFPFKLKEAEIDPAAYAAMLNKWRDFSYFQPFLGNTCFVLDYLKHEVVFFADGNRSFMTDPKEAEICLSKYSLPQNEREMVLCHSRLAGVRLLQEKGCKDYNQFCFFHFTKIRKEGYQNDSFIVIKGQILLATSRGVPYLSLFTVFQSHDRQLHPDSLMDMEKKKLYCNLKDNEWTAFEVKNISLEERQILNLLAEGCPMQEVAHLLGMNYHSIRSRIQRLERYFEENNVRSLLSLMKILRLM
jgi:DNA-binding CsgD family transcriptional regulator